MVLLESFIIGRRLSLRQAPVNWETSCAPAYDRGAFMPITPYLDGALFEPETRRVMGVAFEMACAALRLSDHADPATDVPSMPPPIHRRIIASMGFSHSLGQQQTFRRRSKAVGPGEFAPYRGALACYCFNSESSASTRELV
jgi:hypothetical protein